MAISEAAYKAQVGRRILRLCGVAGWRARELGERAGIGEAGMSRIINGKQLVSRLQLLNIVQAFKSAPEFESFSAEEILAHIEMGRPLIVDLGDETMMFSHSPSDLHLRNRSALANNPYDSVAPSYASVG